MLRDDEPAGRCSARAGLLECRPVGQVLVCGVCGGTGAGKTTLVNDLVDRWHGEVAVVAFDSYYHDLTHLEPAERAAVNYDHPDSLDVELFVAHLDVLRQGGVIEVPEYDFATHTRPGPTRRVEASSLVLVDGILLLAFEPIRERIDHAVFLDVATDLRFERRLRRDTSERGRSAASVPQPVGDDRRPDAPILRRSECRIRGCGRRALRRGDPARGRR